VLRLHILPHAVADVVRLEALRSWRTLRRHGFQLDDVHQELLVHWTLQRHRYDAQRASQATFAAHVCRRRALSLIEAAEAAKRGGGNVCAVSEMAPMDEHLIEIERPDQVSEDTQAIRLGLRSRPEAELSELKMDVENVIATLAPDHAALADGLKRENITGAAASLGISRATAHRRRAAIKTAFIAAGLDGYLRPERSYGGLR